MQFAKKGLMAVAMLAVTYGAQAQTADEVITKHIAALGGKEKLAGINSIVVESTMQVMGNEATSTTTVLNGKGFKTEADVMGSKMVQALTDKGGWTINPMGGGAAEAMPAEMYNQSKDQLDIAGGPLVDYAAKGHKIELQGTEKIGAADAHKLKLTTKEGGVTTYYIDPATYYILQATKTGNMMGQEVELKTTFSDYKKTDYGTVMPYATEVDFGGQFQVTATVNKIEINKAIDPKIFEMPGK